MTVRELLSDVSKWTQGSSARDAQGRGIVSLAADACCWCLAGAVNKCYPVTTDAENVFKQLTTAALMLYPTDAEFGIIPFNDRPNTTFEHIKAVVELANV